MTHNGYCHEENWLWQNGRPRRRASDAPLTQPGEERRDLTSLTSAGGGRWWEEGAKKCPCPKTAREGQFPLMKLGCFQERDGQCTAPNQEPPASEPREGNFIPGPAHPSQPTTLAHCWQTSEVRRPGLSVCGNTGLGVQASASWTLQESLLPNPLGKHRQDQPEGMCSGQ